MGDGARDRDLLVTRLPRIGTRVALKEDRRKIAKIEQHCPSLADGAVYLDRPLDGLRYWNIYALVYANERTTGRKATS